MKLLPALLATLALAPALTAAASSAPTTRPNILVIFADDLGWKDVGFNGTDFYETPNLDHLATQGIVFAHAYAEENDMNTWHDPQIDGWYVGSL